MKLLTILLSLSILSGYGCGADREYIKDTIVCGSELKEPNCTKKTLKTFTIREKLGQTATLLMFHTEWCSSCLQEMREFPKLKEDYGEDLQIIAILLEDAHGMNTSEALLGATCNDIRIFGESFHHSVVLDKTLYYELGGGGYPLNVVLDKDCAIRAKISGLNGDAIDSTIKEIFKEK
jgi:thiol-disulfide isomerase/thioredoxin